MRKIKEDLEFIRFDGVDEVIVYKNSFSDLEKADLKWRKSEDEELNRALCMEVEMLKLSEIREQLKDCYMITIFINEPLKGRILQYGNYGDSWWEIGETCGYA